MAKGDLYAMTPELLTQLDQMYRQLQALLQPGGEADTTTAKRRASVFRPKAVILNESLSGSLLDPGKADATVCKWNATTEKYEQTAKTLDVFGHSGIPSAVDTPGFAFFIDGHFCFFADCEAIDDRDAPPGA